MKTGTMDNMEYKRNNIRILHKNLSIKSFKAYSKGYKMSQIFEYPLWISNIAY
jgi:hypothetical protein